VPAKAISETGRLATQAEALRELMDVATKDPVVAGRYASRGEANREL